jgi:hypothetical protein
MIPADRRTRGGVSWKLLAGSVVGVVIVAPVVHGFFKYEDDYDAAHGLSKAEAAYRAAGMPLTPDQLVPPVSKHDNAAPYLELAFAQVGALTGDPGEGPTDGASNLDHPEASPATVHRLDPALRTALYAASKPSLDFQRPWQEGSLLEFREYSTFKTICRALSTRAEDEAAHHDVKGCTRDIAGARKLAGLIGQDPTIIALLVQVACNGIVSDSVQRCAASLAGDPGALRELEKAVSSPVLQPDLVRALRGEAFMQLATARNPANQGVTIDPSDQQHNSADARRVLSQAVPVEVRTKAATDRVLEYWAKLGPYMNSHRHDPRAIARKTQELSDELNRHETTSYMIASAISGGFQQAGSSIVENEARDVVLRALLAAMIRRAETGRFPTKLAELPGKWIDPFTGGPIRLIASNGPDQSIKVYTLGPSGIDHGGMTRGQLGSANLDSSEFNVVACYPPLLHGSVPLEHWK